MNQLSKFMQVIEDVKEFILGKSLVSEKKVIGSSKPKRKYTKRKK